MAITSKKNTEKHLKNGYVPRVGISYAVDEHGNRIYVEEATPGREYFCEARCGGCEGKLIVKNQGKINAHHFAKKSRTDCLDKWNYDMSPWHRAMQGLFPPEWREVVMEGKDGTWHRADVMNKEKHVVVEFQHSPISTDEFNERNRFYTENGYSVVWVVDAGMEDEHIENMDNQRIGYDTANNTGISFFHFRNRKKTYDEVSLHDRKGVSLFFWVGKWRSLKEKDTVLTASLKGSFILPVWTQGFSGNDYSYFAGKRVFLRSFVSRVTNGTVENLYGESEEDLLKYSNAVTSEAEKQNRLCPKKGYTASTSHYGLMDNHMRYGLIPNLYELVCEYDDVYKALANWFIWDIDKKINTATRFLDDQYIKYRFGTIRSRHETMMDMLLFIDLELWSFMINIEKAGLNDHQASSRFKRMCFIPLSSSEFKAGALNYIDAIRHEKENRYTVLYPETCREVCETIKAIPDGILENIYPSKENRDFEIAFDILNDIYFSCYKALEKRSPGLCTYGPGFLLDWASAKISIYMPSKLRTTQDFICPYCGNLMEIKKEKIIHIVEKELCDRKNSNMEYQAWPDNRHVIVRNGFTCNDVASEETKCDASFQYHMEFMPNVIGDAVAVETEYPVIDAVSGTIYNEGVMTLAGRVAEEKFYLVEKHRWGSSESMPKYDIKNTENMMEEACGVKLTDDYRQKVTPYIRAFIEYCELKICARLRTEKNESDYFHYADGYWLSKSVSRMSLDQIVCRLANMKIPRQLREEADRLLVSLNVS